jgi:hypothetical protein
MDLAAIILSIAVPVAIDCAFHPVSVGRIHLARISQSIEASDIKAECGARKRTAAIETYRARSRNRGLRIVLIAELGRADAAEPAQGLVY